MNPDAEIIIKERKKREVDAELLRSTRQNMPMHEHRRYDLYGDGPHQTAKEGASAEGTEGMFFG